MNSAHRSKSYVPSEQQPQANNNMMPNFPPNQSNNTFFSPQNAFYGAPNQASTSMEFLSNNPLLHVGFNAVEKSMKDITSNTVNKLPIDMKKSLTSIKYYFDVDQTYVVNKLCLLLFPFRPRNWSLGYSDDKPVPPRADTNAPDYYIPLMSAMTYVLVAGLLLGTQNRFTPEQLGTHASSALVWNIIEICVLCFTFYIFNVRSKLRTLDLTAYCGYKYVGMIVPLSLYLMTYSLFVYWITLLYVSISLSYFLLKSLRLQILPDVGGSQAHNPHGNTRRIYLLLSIAFLQPFFIWYFTRHLIAP